MKRTIFSRFTALLMIAAFTLVLTSCGSQEDNAADTTGPITIGLVCPVTGNLAEFGKTFQIAAEIALEEINGNGGINGRELQIEVVDSKSDPKESTEAARKMVSNEKVVAVIGDYSSSACMAAAPVYEEGKLVQFSPTCNHADFAATGPYQFGIMGVTTDVAPYIIRTIVDEYLSADSVAIFYGNNETGTIVVETARQTCEELGITVTAEEPYNIGEQDFTATLSKLRQTNPDVLVTSGNAEDYVKISKQAHQMGWDIPIVGQGIYSNQTITLGGEDVEGALTTTPFMVQEDRPDQVAFAEEYEKRAEVAATVHAFNCYDAFQIMAQALTACGDNITRETVQQQLASIESYDGISGHLEFTENGDVHREYATIVVENGEWKVVVDFNGTITE